MDEIMTEETGSTVEDSKIIKRTTTLRFDREVDMVNAFYEVCGVSIRRQRSETVYNWRHHKNINWETRQILEELGQTVEEEVRYYRVNGWESKADIVDAMGLPRDCAFDWWNMFVHITTYNLSEDQHKAEMRKLYCPMVKAGYTVRHSCETVVSNVNC